MASTLPAPLNISAEFNNGIYTFNNSNAKTAVLYLPTVDESLFTNLNYTYTVVFTSPVVLGIVAAGGQSITVNSANIIKRQKVIVSYDGRAITAKQAGIQIPFIAQILLSPIIDNTGAGSWLATTTERNQQTGAQLNYAIPKGAKMLAITLAGAGGAGSPNYPFVNPTSIAGGGGGSGGAIVNYLFALKGTTLTGLAYTVTKVVYQVGAGGSGIGQGQSRGEFGEIYIGGSNGGSSTVNLSGTLSSGDTFSYILTAIGGSGGQVADNGSGFKGYGGAAGKFSVQALVNNVSLKTNIFPAPPLAAFGAGGGNATNSDTAPAGSFFLDGVQISRGGTTVPPANGVTTGGAGAGGFNGNGTNAFNNGTTEAPVNGNNAILNSGAGGAGSNSYFNSNAQLMGGRGGDGIVQIIAET